MKITHFRLRDTGKTVDLNWMGKGIVPYYLIEVQKGKKWEQYYHGKEPSDGNGFDQTVKNLRYIIHWHKNVHAYQIEGVDEVPLIAIPEGYIIERLYHKGDKSYDFPRYFYPRLDADEHDFDRVFRRYKPALEYLRALVGVQEYAYDVCDIVF